MKKAFTLIELLIVVAIIAILAAIAVPNFLEAQTRAKISRAKSDMRTMATAIESYAVDNNKHPVDGQASPDGQAFWYCPAGPTGASFTAGITTPIAYITSNKLIDPFRTVANATAAYNADAPDSQWFTVEDYRRFRYTNWQYTYVDSRTTPLPLYAADYKAIYGFYRINSSGPDLTAGPSSGVVPGSQSGSSTQYIPYDSTNGTVSAGEIIRSQKYTEQPLIGQI